jgi:hypothetical protein
MSAQEEFEQAALTLQVIQKLRLSLDEVWLHCINSGGYLGEFEFNAYLHGLLRLPAPDRDLIAQAVNELLDDLHRVPRAPYSDQPSHTRRPKP